MADEAHVDGAATQPDAACRSDTHGAMMRDLRRIVGEGLDRGAPGFIAG